MQLEVCRSCGGALERKGDHYFCRFCGNKWMIDAADDVHTVDRANAWAALRDCDFERSAELFENIILKEPKSHEAYWGRSLALSGIIYVTDLNENKKVPTCNNIKEDSFLDHPDLKKAIEYAPTEIANSYTAQAEQIEKIRLEWLGKARKEPPYDIFLSFKDSDRERGIERTQDSVDAQDLYNALVAEGYKVFFSRISLRNKVSEQYEPYIYNAIKTAKVMIVFGEKPEYFSAVWIKNEWSRFKTRIENGEKHKNSLVVAYKNVDPAELPVVLKTRQCLDATQMTFLPDLLRHVKRVIEESAGAAHIEKVEIKGGQISKRATKIANETLTTREIGEGGIANTDITEKQQLDLVKTYIKSGEWEDAASLLDTILFSNPTYAEAIWLSLATKYKAKNNDVLVGKITFFTDEDYALIEKVLNCADKSFAANILDILYNSHTENSAEVYYKVIKLILPYKYDSREDRIKEAFAYSLDYEIFNIFNLLLSTLDTEAVDEYIEYNFNYISATNSINEKNKCIENILSVDSGNIKALKMKFDSMRQWASVAELTEGFEEILKYSDDPQTIIRETVSSAVKSIKTNDDCVFALQLFKYYSGELADFKEELQTLASNMIKNGFFDHAEHVYKLLLTFDANNASVYWGICLIKLGARSDRGIINASTPIKSIPEYTKYLTLVNESRRLECMNLAKKQSNKHEQKKKARKGLIAVAACFMAFVVAFTVGSLIMASKNKNNYQNGLDLMKQGKYAEAIEVFNDIEAYRDSAQKIDECKAYIAYNKAIALMNEGKYDEAIIAFEKMNGFNDSLEKIEECKLLILEGIYNEALALMNECKYTEAITAFEALNGYKDSADKIIECQTTIKDIAYNQAVSLMNNGKYDEALAAFEALNGYKDSADKIIECQTTIKDIAYNEAVSLMNNGKYEEALTAFEVLNDYRDSNVMIAECNQYLNLKYTLIGEAYVVSGFDSNATDKINVKIPANYNGKPVTSIGYVAFFECSSLTSITIPDSVTSIGIGAFSNCYNLTSITVPDSVTSIGDGVFAGCSSLTSITIPDSVTSIGEEAFAGCSSLTSITIPEGVTSIGYWAFNGCSSLESITIPEGVTSIGSSAFEGCSSLTSITIPEGVTSIGDWAFNGCSSLESITIPDSVASIGDGVFAGCTSLESITVDKYNCVYYGEGNCLIETASKTLIVGCNNSVIPADGSVTSIGDWAFEYCSSLTSITIPDSVTSIGYSAFEYCSSLTSITIPDSVTSIGYSAFEFCSNLTSITIPDSVTSIGDYAFSSCLRLKTVYFTGTEDEWAAISIDDYNDCLKNATIVYNYVPEE